MDIKPESEEEIEEGRKFRMNQTYGRVGYVRFYLFLALGAVGVSGYILFRKYKRLPVLNTPLYEMTIYKLKYDPSVI